MCPLRRWQYLRLIRLSHLSSILRADAKANQGK
jgi:hypothetical protein